MSDRLPPYSEASERGVLACILLAPNETLPQVLVRLSTAGEDAFYDPRHKLIFNAMAQMFEFGRQIDVITLLEFLTNQDTLQDAGGLSYLSPLPDAVPSAANVEYYLDTLVEKYVMRKAIHVATEMVTKFYNHNGAVEDIMDEFEREAMSIRNGMTADVIPSMKECAKKAMEQIEDFAQRAGRLIGLPTGFSDLDKLTGGLEDGTVFVIAARPSMGKTSLAMNIAEHVAVDQQLPVGVFSLEMTRESLVLRMLCSRARVNLRNIRDGFIADRDYPKLTHSAGKLSGAKIWIEDISGLSVMSLRARARRMAQQYGIKLLVIDYLQLLHALIDGKRIQNRQQEIAEVSGGVKALAKELGIPIILLSQLNRSVDREKGRKPTMGDLRESGAIEQDADTIGLLYKAKSAEDEDDTPAYFESVPTNLLICKQRNGPTGDVCLLFLKPFTRFENAAKLSDDDIPNDAQQTLV